MRKVSEQEPEGFPDFWAVWLPIARRNDGRGEARQTYRKHMLNGAEPQDIIDGAKWYARGVRTAKDREYVPMASTWLNRCAYEDGCERERAEQRRQVEQAEKAEQGSNVTTLRPTPPKPFFLQQYERKQGEGA